MCDLNTEVIHRGGSQGMTLCGCVWSGPSLSATDKWPALSAHPWEKGREGSGPCGFPITTDTSLGLYFYFRSGLLTQVRSVNQLTRRFAAVVLGMTLHAVAFLIFDVENILVIPESMGGYWGSDTKREKEINARCGTK